MKNLFIVFICILAGFSHLMGQITISEVMFDPLDNETTDEWVEVYNLSDSSISFNDWKLVIGGDSLNITLPPDSNDTKSAWTLPAYSYTIIHDTDYWANPYQPYEDLIPVDIKRFGASITLTNSTGKEIQLLDASNSPVSIYTYSTGNSHGYTDEKIIPKNSNDASNWSDSNILHGSPGSRNSVSPNNYDLGILTRPQWYPDPTPPGVPVDITLVIRNPGMRESREATCLVGIDKNRNSQIDSGELVYQDQITPIPADDSLEISLTVQLESGVHPFIALVTYTEDEDTSNNRYSWLMPVSYPAQTVVLNEIMYNPDDGGPEWIELFNTTNDSICMEGWQFQDATATTATIDTCIILLPKSYMVVASAQLDQFTHSSDSLVVTPSFPTLNNSGDDLYIKDQSGFTVEFVKYSSSWGGNNGLSLERINPYLKSNSNTNWASTINVSKGTPTMPNSVMAPEYDITLYKLDYHPTSSSEFQVTIGIRNTGQKHIPNVSAQLFRDLNENNLAESRELFHTTDNLSISLGDSTSIIHTIKDLPGGYHQVLVRAVTINDQVSSNDQKYLGFFTGYPKKSLLINEIMYRPETGEPEWFEVYVQADSIDVRGFTIRDKGHSGTLNRTSRHMYYQDDYVILAPDSSVYQTYSNSDFPVEVADDFPVLNNGTDSIRVLDGTGQILDELYYTDKWGGDMGVSLERINAFHLSSLSYNWTSSTHVSGATPGQLNSVAEWDDSGIQLIRSNFNERLTPFQFFSLGYRLYNSTEDTLRDITIRYGFDDNTDGHLQSGEIVETDVLSSIFPADSMHLYLELYAPKLPGYHSLILQVQQDEFVQNFYAEIWIPYPFQSVMFNEFLPDPSGIIPAEYIEIINTTTDTIPLFNWRFAINNREIMLSDSITLYPGSLHLYAPDSSSYFPKSSSSILTNWTSLPNSGASLRLSDQFGNKLDSLVYSDLWEMESGYSQERIHIEPGIHSPSNWKPSYDWRGGTPGQENSLFIPESSEEEDWLFTPKIFSPDADGIDDFFQIAYRGTQAIQFITIRIYDITGRLIKTIASDESAPVNASWEWEGRKDNGEPAAMGMYIIQIEYQSVEEINGQERFVVILAKKL